MSLPTVTPPQPVKAGASDAAERARELQRQLEALMERLREAQRRAEEARKRAIEAQHKADQAKKAEETAKALADKTKLPVDEAAAKKAEQNTKLQDARLKKESAEVDLQDKEVTLLQARVAQKKEQNESTDGKASPQADQKVERAQDHRDDAQRTSDRSNLYADYQEKETKAQDAEAAVVELTPSPGRPSVTITDAESQALETAKAKATELRSAADGAKTEFTTAVGAHAQAEFFGDPPAVRGGTQPATQTAAPPNDPLHSPLQQLLQVSTRPSGPNLYLPLLTPTDLKATPLAPTISPLASQYTLSPTKDPVVTPDVTKTLSSIADGKSVEQVAKERGVGTDKVIAEAKAAGIQLESSTPSTDVQRTTVKRGDATLTYTNDMHSGTVTVKASLADPKAPGGRQTIEASQDGNGRFSQTVEGDKTGDTTTHVIDPGAGTRTDIVVDADGKRTETKTDLTGATVRRPVMEGEGYLDVAKAAGLTPEQLLALNPDVDYGKPLKPGQEMVVTGVPTTVKTYNKDGSTLEETTASDGSLTAVATNASGHRTLLMGDPDAKDGQGEAARKAIFDDKKTVADVAKSMGLTQDQVLALLPPGTVDKTPASADTSGIETRTLFDPTTNRVVVETLDPRRDRYVRQDIDDKTVFKVRQYDPEKKKYVTSDVEGGVGYLQKLADDKLALVGDYDKQISDLDIAIRYSKRMGESVSDLQDQRKQLVALRDTAKGEAGISQGRATSALIKNQQVKLDDAAANAYQRQFVARPGSDEKKAATQALNDTLALTDKVDRLTKAADKDVEFLIADADRQQKHSAKVDADENLQAEFQKWKDDVWMWQNVPKETADEMKAEGQKPPLQAAYRTEEEKNEAAWEAFVSRHEFLDEYGDETLTDAERPARDAWVHSNRATAAELESNDKYYEVSNDKGTADANVIQGDIDRLQAKKDAWHNANPKDFLENFPEVKGEHGGQKELDQLNDDLTKLKVGVLLDGKDQEYNQYLMTLSATDLQDPRKLEEASQKYGEDHGKDIEKVDQQIDDLVMARPRNGAQVSEDYIKQWAKDNPKLQKQLDELAATKATNPRMADALIEQREELLTSSHEGLQLKAALAMKDDTQFKLTQVGNDDVARIQKDLDGASKSAESQTWLRDVFSDTAEDSQAYTQEQLDKATQLRDDLASGKITLTDYTRQQNELMDSYGDKSIDIARELRDSDETWAVVDDAVRMTVSAAAGIAATLASGGNVAVGIAVGVGVNQLWDTSNDIYAAANGRDMYADGHSSLLTLYARSQIDPGSITSEQVAFTLKDDVVDVAHAAVSATGVGAGMRTSAALTARIAAKQGVDIGAGQALNLGSRVVVGARSGLVAQSVDGAGRVGVETLHVGLDGKLGTEEGAQRIGATAVSSAVGVFTAPLTGGVSGAIPMNKLAVGVSAQFLNDAAGSLGTGELIALANHGRHMNQAEFIAASLQAIPGTMTNIALHPSVGRSRATTQAQVESAPSSATTPLRTTGDVTDTVDPAIAGGRLTAAGDSEVVPAIATQGGRDAQPLTGQRPGVATEIDGGHAKPSRPAVSEADALSPYRLTAPWAAGISHDATVLFRHGSSGRSAVHASEQPLLFGEAPSTTLPQRPRLAKEEGQRMADLIHLAGSSSPASLNRKTVGITELADGRIVVSLSGKKAGLTENQRRVVRLMLQEKGFASRDIIMMEGRDGNPYYRPPGERLLDPETRTPCWHAEQKGIQAGKLFGSEAVRQWSASGKNPWGPEESGHGGAACLHCLAAQRDYKVINETGIQPPKDEPSPYLLSDGKNWGGRDDRVDRVLPGVDWEAYRERPAFLTAPQTGDAPLMATRGRPSPQPAKPAWMPHVMEQLALHPAGKRALLQVLKEEGSNGKVRLMDPETELEMFYGDLHKLRRTASDNPQAYESRMLAAWHLLEREGAPVAVDGFAPLLTPRPEVYQIRPMTPPRLDNAADFATALHRVTPQSSRIAEALVSEDAAKRIDLHLLSRDEFREQLSQRTGRSSGVLAFARGKSVFLNRDTDNWEQLLAMVHEGTHALDYLEHGDAARSGSVLIGDMEANAYYHESEYAQATGLLGTPRAGFPSVVRSAVIDPLSSMKKAHEHIVEHYPQATRAWRPLRGDQGQLSALDRHEGTPGPGLKPGELLTDAVRHARNGTVRPSAMVSKGNSLESVDVGGPAIFARQAEMIRGAHEEVLIQTFVWDPNSKAADTLLGALSDLASRHAAAGAPGGPVKVRLLVNEEAGFAKRFMQLTMANKKAPQPNSRPEGRLPDVLLGDKYAHLARDLDLEVRVHRHGSVNSLHSKSVIVDGQRAGVTGANIQPRNDAPNPAYDFGVTLAGPVARGLREDFVVNWNRSVNPDQPTQALQRGPSPRRAGHLEPTDGVPMAVLTKKPTGNPLSVSTRNPQDQAFLAAIRSARSSVQIFTPNLNAPAVVAALREAVNRGVRVQLLISKGFNDRRENNRIAGGTNADAIGRLLHGRVDPGTLEIRYFRNPAAPLTEPVPDGNVIGSSHAKFMSVDGKIVIFGSANMDKTSWHFSGETNIAVFDPAGTAVVKSKVFDPAWHNSEPVQLSDWSPD